MGRSEYKAVYITQLQFQNISHKNTQKYTKYCCYCNTSSLCKPLFLIYTHTMLHVRVYTHITHQSWCDVELVCSESHYAKHDDAGEYRSEGVDQTHRDGVH